MLLKSPRLPPTSLHVPLNTHRLQDKIQVPLPCQIRPSPFQVWLLLVLRSGASRAPITQKFSPLPDAAKSCDAPRFLMHAVPTS